MTAEVVVQDSKCLLQVPVTQLERDPLSLLLDRYHLSVQHGHEAIDEVVWQPRTRSEYSVKCQ